MGVIDFAKDAGASIGIGTTKAEKDKSDKIATQLKEATKAKIAADRAAKKASAAKKKAAEKAKAAAERQKAQKAAEAEREAAKGVELTKYVGQLGLKVQRLNITFDDGVATINGLVRNKADREKVALAVGNVQGVRRVNDKITVKPLAKKGAAPATPAARKAAATRRKQAAGAQTMHKVRSGDTLSKLAKKYLGDPMRYPEIFKANQPMLTDPDKIMVGQVLRIPKA
jgi:LysM repeat protein